jgi:hypothetical protein
MYSGKIAVPPGGGGIVEAIKIEKLVLGSILQRFLLHIHIHFVVHLCTERSFKK